jgi:acyl dehydratase
VSLAPVGEVQRIHGALETDLKRTLCTALALLGLQWDFKGPVCIGDTIHAVVTPVQKRPTQKPSKHPVKAAG